MNAGDGKTKETERRKCMSEKKHNKRRRGEEWTRNNRIGKEECIKIRGDAGETVNAREEKRREIER